MKISLFRRILSKRTRTKNELVSSLPGFLSSVKDNFIAVLLNRLHTGPLSSCTLSDKPGFRKLQRWGTGKSIEKKKKEKKKEEKKRTTGDTNIHYLESYDDTASRNMRREKWLKRVVNKRMVLKLFLRRKEREFLSESTCYVT